MVLAYNPNVGAGLASGVDKLANAFIERKRRQGLASGLEQIQGGDWEGGINTISETDPNTALGLVQNKQKADDAMALEQMKLAAAEQARNSLTPYQREMLALKRQQVENGGNGTVAQQNIEYLAKNMGIPLDQAAMLVYGGNNPTLNMATLGQKGQEAYDKAQGEALAKQQEQQRLAEQNDARLKAVQESLQNSPDTVGFYSPLKTAVARALGGLGDKEYLSNRGYNIRSLGEVQNALIAEARASGQSGINTAREIEQATKGLNENSSDAEINGALQAMQDSIQRLRNSQKPSLMQYNQTPSDEDAWGGI